jgi:hypothetical protein
LYPTFKTFYISASESAPATSEGDPNELTTLICPVFDFVSAVARHGKAREWWEEEGNFSSLVQTVFDYVQMTDEDVRCGALQWWYATHTPSHVNRRKHGRQMQTHLLFKKTRCNRIIASVWQDLI